jgi:transcriptional activator cubitus interruptus
MLRVSHSILKYKYYFHYRFPPPTSAAASMGLSDGGAASLLGLPPPQYPLSPTYINSLHPHHGSPNHSLRLSGSETRLPSHQDYLNAAAQRLGELQASAALASAVNDPLQALEAARLAQASPSLRASISRNNRKRALSASPYSDLDLNTLIRYSPTATALHLLNGGISPSSSGSYGHLSAGN